MTFETVTQNLLKH